jgi:hypothetical protein
VTWPRREKLILTLGVVLWIAAAALTPGEMHAARVREKIGARTAIALLAYLGAALCVLRGLPRGKQPELPLK